MIVIIPALYGRVLFSRTLYSIDTFDTVPIPVWITVIQPTGTPWTEVPQR